MKRIRQWRVRRQPVIKAQPKSRRHAWRVIDTPPTSRVMYAAHTPPSIESVFVPVYVKFDENPLAMSDPVLARAMAALEAE